MGTLNFYNAQGLGYTPVLGSTKSTAQFIYGPDLPSNVKSVHRAYAPITTQVNFTGQSTASTAAISATIPATVTSGYGLYEKYASFPDIVNQTTLTANAQGEYNAKATAAEIIEIVEPTVDAPSPFEHYYIGDTIYVSCRRGSMIFTNRAQRIYGIDITLDQGGRELVKLTTANV